MPKGYKGFKPGLICKGKQYAENTTFEESGTEICEAGVMHYCHDPLDVLDFYPLVNDDCEFNEFAEVEPESEEIAHDEGKKFASSKLHIGAKLSFAGFVKSCIDFTLEKVKSSEDSGNYAQLASSGDYAQLASSGNYAQLASSGDYAQLASSGYSAQLASSGDSAQLASSGDSAKLASSGYYAKLASSGDYAQLASSGDFAEVNSTGKDAVIMCAGYESAARAKKGSWITLAEWKKSEERGAYIPVCVKTEQVDGERIKEDTFYMLRNGEFVEA